TVAGSYATTLTVTDDDGATSQATFDVSVTASGPSVSVSGTIQVLSSSAIDSDVNDRFTTPTSNNDFANAQPLLNPTTLGGFANLPNTGASTGALFSSGDPGDFYRVSLTGNETILLNIAETSADLDLRLWDENEQLVAASAGSGNSESLSTVSAGEFFVEVVPVSGATNYVLNIGQAISTMARPATRVSDAFVPGEFIVHSSTEATAALESGYDLEVHSRQTATKLLTMRNPTRTLSALSIATGKRLRLPRHGRMSPTARRKYETLLAIKGIAETDGVRYAEPNLLRMAHVVPNDTFYGMQWHYQNINLPVAWDVTTGDSNVIVAVIDTGVLLAHPDLDNQVTAGYDFISNVQQANDGDGPDPDPNDPGDLAFGGSSSFHGTHVAGTIAAESDNAQGVAGVAWLSRIMPLRVLGIDGGTTFDVIQAVLYAAGMANQSGTLPLQPADIINMSLGSNFSSQSEQAIIDQVRAAGVIVVASAGNDASDIPSYPAAYNGVVSVAATNISNGAAPYSNFGATIDVAAPGGYNATDLNGAGIGDGVISAMGDDGSVGPVQFGYAALSGTSMAAPHVAGVVALMKALHPNLTPDEFDNALAAGDLTDDLGTPGRDNIYGFGLINAQKAVLAALALATGQGSNPGPILTASASSLNFGAFLDTLDFTVQNVGTGSLTINSVTTDQAWLTATPTNVDGSGLGTYTLTVDRALEPLDGTYTSTVTVNSDANTVTLTAIMQVASLGLSADAGLHYIILVDGNGDTVGQT
ncbi:MAG: S8 family serine peptidase, partial [Pseudomonadales bacterium]